MKHARWAFIALVVWSVPLFAQQLDPHIIYEDKCSGCHAPDAGEFVSNMFVQKEGEVVSVASGQKIIPFLQAGHGGLSASEIAALEAHFRAILQTDRLFFRKCRNCHVSARQIAQSSLRIRDGALVGRYTGQNIERYLGNHGRLDPDEVTIIVEELKRQLNVSNTR